MGTNGRTRDSKVGTSGEAGPHAFARFFAYPFCLRELGWYRVDTNSNEDFRSTVAFAHPFRTLYFIGDMAPFELGYPQ